MNENIKVLLEKVSKDEAVIAKLKAIKDPDEAYALVSSIQGGFTKEEFIDTVKKIQAAAEGELSDEEVASAAGGFLGSDTDLSVINSRLTGAPNPLNMTAASV